MAKVDYGADVVAFFRDLYPLDTGRAIIPPFLETWLYTAFPLPAGDPAARNVLDSRSKKQGKSALAGMVALYMATRKRNGEVVIAAADQDQAKDRVYKSLKYAVENGPLGGRAKVFRDVIELDNGSIIQAIPFDWRGAAGGNYSAVIFDELHVFTTENHRRLWDELIIPPTQPAGVRWVSTYAGFTGESVLLEDLWNRALTGERIAGELPIFRKPGASLLALIDQGEESWRMPWTTPEYMAEIRESERANTFRRLWLNEWVSAESEFIQPEKWAACYSPEVKPLTVGDSRRVVLGADASTSRDLTALVGVCYDTKLQAAEAVFCRVWKPARGVLRLGKPTVDLSETIGAEILRLHQAGQVDAVYYDPYQLHSIAIDLEKAGVRMIELPQTSGRIEADQALYDAITAQSLRHYGDPTLTEHINNSVAIETPRGFRLAKEKTSRKIDAAVALSMAHYGALQLQKATGQTTVIRDPFWNWGADQVVGYPDRDDWSYAPHPAGVTWRTCKRRNKGCEACQKELEAEGWFAEQDRIAELTRGQGPQDETEYYKQLLANIGLGPDRIRQDRERIFRDEEFLRKFRKHAAGK